MEMIGFPGARGQLRRFVAVGVTSRMKGQNQYFCQKLAQ